MDHIVVLIELGERGDERIPLPPMNLRDSLSMAKNFLFSYDYQPPGWEAEAGGEVSGENDKVPFLGP